MIGSVDTALGRNSVAPPVFPPLGTGNYLDNLTLVVNYFIYLVCLLLNFNYEILSSLTCKSLPFLGDRRAYRRPSRAIDRCLGRVGRYRRSLSVPRRTPAEGHGLPSVLLFLSVDRKGEKIRHPSPPSEDSNDPSSDEGYIESEVDESPVESR